MTSSVGSSTGNLLPCLESVTASVSRIIGGISSSAGGYLVGGFVKLRGHFMFPC
jgi:hypothetical protein